LSITLSSYRRGIIETWGWGTLKIARLMLEAGLQPPAFSSREGAVVVIFGLPGKSLPATSAKTTPGKTAVEILRLLKADPALSVPQLAQKLGKSDSAILRAIRRLRESGRLERVGPDKGGHWKVNE
jgi:ATP-dependent DNA helicase RecG